MLHPFKPARSALLAALAAVVFTVPAPSAVRLPAVLSDHAVLKKSAATRVWGTAAAGEAVAVEALGVTTRAVADDKGKWSVALDLSRATAEPFELKIHGENELVVHDVLAGEVWLASGQSNMDFQLPAALEGKAEVSKPARPTLRFFKVALAAEKVPVADVRGRWIIAAPDTLNSISAVAYFFAQRVQQTLDVPVGVIQSSWGGSSCEAWISPDALDTVADLKADREKYWKLADDVKGRRVAFTAALKKWIADHHREDRPTPDPMTFAGPTADHGWTAVDVHGVIKGPGIPPNGVVWLRHEVDVPEAAAGAPASFNGTFDAIEQVYWNGRLIRARSINDYFSPSPAYLTIPADQVHAGKSVLALRLYSPLNSPAFPTYAPSLMGKSLADGWIGKAEYALDESAKCPGAPAFPPVALDPQRTPAFLFNAMIAPLTPATLSGVIWYQGEDNASRAAQYNTVFPLLIKTWRDRFSQPDLPFLFCQLPNFNPKRPEPFDASWAELREAQTNALKLPHTGQAVLIDTGEANNIHPLNKRPAGERLADIALGTVYGRKGFAVSGPKYDGFTIENGHALVRFRHADDLKAAPLPDRYNVKRPTGETAALVRNSPDGPLEGFQICGVDRKWHWATATIRGSGEAASVDVHSPAVPAPVAVRYAWSDNPTCNLTDASGLPASPFRTDDFPLSTEKGRL